MHCATEMKKGVRIFTKWAEKGYSTTCKTVTIKGNTATA
jgi:hypothetical protein